MNAVKNAAAERDQHVVDEKLAGKADEIHAAFGLAPAPGRIGDAHQQPQRDRQVQSGQHQGVARRRERIDVDDYGCRDETHGQSLNGGIVQRPFPGEVAGYQWQHEQAGVAGVERCVFIEANSKKRRELHEHGRGQGKHKGHDCIALYIGLAVPGLGRQHDELLPQSVGVFARKFPRECIQATHALDRDQDGLLIVQTAVDQRGDLFAKMILELCDIHRMDCLAASKEIPPLLDLALQRLCLVSRWQPRGCLMLTGPRGQRRQPFARCRAAWRRPPATAGALH